MRQNDKDPENSTTNKQNLNFKHKGSRVHLCTGLTNTPENMVVHLLAMFGEPELHIKFFVHD